MTPQTTSASRVPAPWLALVLACGLALPALAETEVIDQIDASASVEAVTIGKKKGFKHLRKALGGGIAESTARQQAHEALELRRAFREMLDEGGDYRLTLVTASVETDQRRLKDYQSKRSYHVFKGEFAYQWRTGDELLHEGRFTVEGRTEYDDKPHLKDIELGARRLIETAAIEAFAQGWEAGVFGNRPTIDGTRWIP